MLIYNDFKQYVMVGYMICSYFVGKLYVMVRNKRNNKEYVMPPKWNDDRCRQGYELALLGLKAEEMARVMDVSVQSIDYWIRTKPEFREAVNKGRTTADQEVVISLLKKCTGYSCPETKVNIWQGEVIETTVTKHYPPDTTAIIFWLKNRQREKWCDVQRKENDTNINISIQKDLKAFTIKELELIESIGMKELLGSAANKN